MSAKKKQLLGNMLVALAAYAPLASHAAFWQQNANSPSLTTQVVVDALGWVPSKVNTCGGYYLEPAFVYPVNPEKKDSVEVTSHETLFAQHGTSILNGNVTLTRSGQQITGEHGYLYRDPQTAKLQVIEMVGDVHLREPNTLVVAKKARYYFDTKYKSLMDILYRTTLATGTGSNKVTIAKVPTAQTLKPRKITALTAWGHANEFNQIEPKIYELTNASFSTCPPINPAWQIRGSRITLNKISGRGYATNARLYVKGVPVFYFPYINFSIDNQRKSGFLWPTVASSSKWGLYVLTPYYWNMAPNYDMTIIPGLLSSRGVQFTDNFRYLNSLGNGGVNYSILPNDRAFSTFQQKAVENPSQYYPGQPLSTAQAEVNRLVDASPTRQSLAWHDDTHYNDNWSSHVNFNYASDDYYLQDFGSNLDEVTQNQLLQEGDLYYKSPNWNFTGRLQNYQTLHPVNEAPVLNQYRRVPQLILNGDYPDQAYGLEYFISNDLTHFELLNTPGATTLLPVGNRINVQPGIALPFNLPYFYFRPRAQLSLTDYNLNQTADTNTPNDIQRAVPIVDIASGLYLTRDTNLFNRGYQQTLEPALYYVYIPYRSQYRIPVFDTAVNTLTYDQIFNYNRFSGLDRIGDANQLGVGITSRFIDSETGIEKVRLGVGDIFYFANRRVTLCNDAATCSDNPTNPSNDWSLSPISGVINYYIQQNWGFTGNGIWNPISKQLDNTSLSLNYKSDEGHIMNFGYSYARGGDILSGIQQDDPSNNLKVTDFSFAWPLTYAVSAVGRWSQNWNHAHLQNLLYGLQYDTCCWAVRLVGGRAFLGFDPSQNNKPTYNRQFYIQFSLKGVGDVGTGDPSSLLNSITGYNPQFGQEI